MIASKTLLFDLDGTLSDPRQGIVKSIVYALEKLNYTAPPAAELEHYIGPPLRESFAHILKSSNQEKIEQAVSLYRERFARIGLYENDLYPEIALLLADLHAQGITLFVATSKPTVYAEKIIDHFNLTRFFKKIYGSELEGTRADKSELLNYLLTEESLSPTETIMIGDRKHDAIAAVNNSLQAIGVLWGFGSQEELLQAGVDAALLCQTPLALRSLLIS